MAGERGVARVSGQSGAGNMPYSQFQGVVIRAFSNHGGQIEARNLNPSQPILLRRRRGRAYSGVDRTIERPFCLGLIKVALKYRNPPVDEHYHCEQGENGLKRFGRTIKHWVSISMANME